jgi:hypothetical protein
MNAQNILNHDVNISLEALINYLGFANNSNFILLKNNGEELKKFPVRVQYALKQKLNLDAVYVFNGKPVILFKTFHAKDDDELRKFHRSIWNFNESPLAFAILSYEIRVYNARKLPLKADTQ